MTEYYDSRETRAPAEREQALLAALPAQIAHAQKNAPGFSRILAGVDAQSVTSRAALARLPVTRKSDLADLQQQQAPLGGLNATPVNKLAKIYVSPGPIYEPEGTASDWWRTARALFAAGIRPGDLVINTFAYHAARRVHRPAVGLSAAPWSDGIGTEMRCRPSPFRISAFIGTPSFLKLIVDK
jgi:phenylacetate-CoA ligase